MEEDGISGSRGLGRGVVVGEGRGEKRSGWKHYWVLIDALCRGCIEEGERGEGKKRSSVEIFLGLFSSMYCVEEWIGVGLRVGEGGGKKNGVGRNFSKVILIDALSRGWMEE